MQTPTNHSQTFGLYSVYTSIKSTKIKFIPIVKSVLSDYSKIDKTKDLMTDYGLMQVKSIAECSKGSILQYFRPSLSYYFSLRSLFCLFLSGQFYWVLQV